MPPPVAEGAFYCAITVPLLCHYCAITVPLLCHYCATHTKKYRKKQQDLQRLKTLKTCINKGKTRISAGL